ncbi:aspartate/glutamate racemase family protein [Arthrobacter globiformis]|uniref:aspartate/glutamate racemase family protein n=1 Tax=Arthrobacter globiformis TaxID=1665 RepID=UPI002786AF1A|nr:amino acid racemase [Arthrobacter globiformis]MDQ0865057.1 aspartate racemase [Arthrobacter globiformis]
MKKMQTAGTAPVKTLAGLPLLGIQRTTARAGSNRVVGILGGMGPAATADFYLKLIQATPAAVDQEHLRVLIWSDPTIPDRTEALLTHGEDPTPALIAGAKMLRQSGARMLAVPCNTAHAFLAAVQTEVDIPIIHMIEETANYVHRLKPAIRRVGLLSTTGTQRAGLYQSWLDRIGVQVLSPAPDSQEQLVMASIRGIKGGQGGQAIKTQLTTAAQELVDAGAEAIIGGCTEVPVGLAPEDVAVPFVDPARILADSVVRTALARSDPEYSIQYATSPHEYR